ncbi:hypothetical protein MBTS_23160, partial [Methylobacterium bullatum]|nr:hypothetical protein [Methylobacterium bullatum]
GGEGADTFLFRTWPGTGNTDHIRDFSIAEDVVTLSSKVFTALRAGALAEDAFKDLSSGSTDADDRVLYDATTGTLSYDADGSGAGTARTFAVIDTTVLLTFADVLVV